MRLLCFGDSNTFGYDPASFLGSRYKSEDRWVDILQAQTGWEVINAGQNGREIPRRSFELESALQLINRHQPDLLLIMLGTNDLLQGAGPDETAVRMEGFLMQLLPVCKHMVLISPPPLKRGVWVTDDNLVETSVRLARHYGVLARRLGIPFVDTSHWNLQLCFDGVHLTEEDHHLFAQNVIKAAVK